MEKVLFVLFSLFFVTENTYSQTTSPLNDLIKIVERDSQKFPFDVSGLGTGVKAYLEDSYYSMVCEVNDMSIFGKLRDYKKVVKKAIVEQLTYDCDFIDTAKLLIACNKEMKYLYVYKGWETEI